MIKNIKAIFFDIDGFQVLYRYSLQLFFISATPE